MSTATSARPAMFDVTDLDGVVAQPIKPALEDTLDAGLAIAVTRDALTFIALPVRVVSAPAIIDEFRDQPLATWTSSELTIVGIGVARELRGSGAARWAEVIAGAHAISTNTPDVDDEPRDTLPTHLAGQSSSPVPRDLPCAVIDGRVGPIADLGFARPRFLGGAAFAPGAADRAPWVGFGDAWFALPRWTYVHDGARAFLVLGVDARDAAHAARWRDELAIFQAAVAGDFLSRHQPAMVELTRADTAQWRDQVTDITDAIAKGTCSKVVAARTASIVLAAPVRAAELLAALDARHADCVRVLIKPPGAGALIAATPERLVRRDGDFVQCDALAGSIARTGDVEAAAATLRASAKDRREHQLVVDAIRTALTDAGAQVLEPEPEAEPAVRALRHVIHLHTPFRAVLRTPRHVLELAARLHPTPAVGGTPTEIASDWIRSHEPVARGWYAAPVGWFDLDGNGELAVALRSGVVAGNRAHLWAGAGIVAGSDPDRELAETEVKLRAMLGALGINELPAEAPAR
ncbi:MAG: isochorismate synthase [Deltaproteobacteria bacterium]|nr:isochorismate synthase [Deltaproteobacteria bacterium]